MYANARLQIAYTICQYHKSVDISVMQWSEHIPDMNPVENLWEELKRRVRAKIPAIGF